MASFLDVCRFTAASSGTGDFVVSAGVTGYQTPALAGAVNGAIYRYRAESADLSQWEIGYGAYTSGSVTLARTTVLYNSSGTGTGSGQSGAGTKISFSAAPQVAVVFLAEDFNATGQIPGTSTKDNASSGNIGEYGIGTLSFASRTSLTTATAKTITSVSIPAGDFEVTVRIHYEPAGTTSITQYITSVSATTNTLDQSSDRAVFTNMAANVPTNTVTQTVTRTRISQASTTTWYAVAQCTFTVSTVTAWGSIEYRRCR